MARLPNSITRLIGAFERLPGIGPKSATRLAFYLLNTPTDFVANLAGAMIDIKERIKTCKECFGVAEGEICEICALGNRDKRVICVVERSIDVLAIENVGGFGGVYHVLGGVINPLEHTGPEDLRIDELISRLSDGMEVILAMNPTMEGEATALYIKRKIDGLGLKDLAMTRIGSGLPIGADLEFADQATIARAMEGRRNL